MGTLSYLVKCGSGLAQIPRHGRLAGKWKARGELNHLFGSVFSDLGSLEVAGLGALPGTGSVNAGMNMPKVN